MPKRIGWVLMPESGTRLDLMDDARWTATDADGEDAPAVAKAINATFAPAGAPHEGDPRANAILRLAKAVGGIHDIDLPPGDGMVVH